MQSHLEVEGAFRSGHLCRVPPPDLQLCRSPRFSSSFQGTLDKTSTRDTTTGLLCVLSSRLYSISRDHLILRSQQTQCRVDFRPPRPPPHYVQCLVGTYNATGLFCRERGLAVLGGGVGDRAGSGVKVPYRKGENNSWEGEEKEPLRKKGVACGYVWLVGTDVSRWRGR